MPRYYGERIMLREFMKEDIPSIRQWVNDPEIVDNLDDIFLHPHTLNETENYVNSVLERKIPNQETFVIADILTEEFLGSINLHNIDPKNRAAELGIAIGKREMLGKGYGTEALKVLIKFAFNRLNLQRLQLTVHAYNTRAYKAYKKCGFIEEGRLRQKLYIHGKYEDVIVMGLLKDEFKDGN